MAGNYWAFEEFVTSSKMNEQTDNDGAGIAQNAYQILQANNVFENKDYLAADEFTDSDGTNNTVNTGSSTADHDSENSYYLIQGVEDDLSGDTTYDPDSFSNPSNAFDWDTGTSATKSETPAGSNTRSWELGKTFTAKTVKTLKLDVEYTKAANDVTNAIYLETYDGSSWSVFSTLVNNDSINSGPLSDTIEQTFDVDSSIQGVRIRWTFDNSTGLDRSISATANIIGYSESFQSSGTVVVDSNTLTLDGTEKAISIYTDTTLPTGNGPDGTDDTTATSLTESSNSSVTDKRGIKINPNEDLYVQSVTKESTCTATKAYIYDTTPTLITSTDFSGDTATFSLAEQSKLTSGTAYYLLLDNDGSSYTEVTDSTVTFPISGTYMDITAGVNNGSTETTSEYYNITEIVSQTNTTSSSEATSMTVDISDGTTTLSGQTIANKTTGVLDLSSLSSGTLELTFYLSTLDTSVTPEFYGYGVYIYK